MMLVIEELYHRIEKCIAEMTVRKGNSREWDWVLLNAALKVNWIWLIREYVRRQ